MATLIEVPGADLPVPKPARRRGKLLGLAALVVLVLAAVSGVVYVWRYQPIVSDGGLTWAGELTADSSSFGQGQHPGNRVENTYGAEVIVGPLPNGGRMGLLIDLQNNGRFPVTVEKVEPILGKPFSNGTRLFASRDKSGAGGNQAPATAITLPAHQSRTMGLAIDVRKCQPDYTGVRAITTDVVLTYRFAGIRHKARVPMHEFAVSLQLPPKCG